MGLTEAAQDVRRVKGRHDLAVLTGLPRKRLRARLERSLRRFVRELNDADPAKGKFRRFVPPQ